MHSDGPEVLFGIEKNNNIICIQETVNETELIESVNKYKYLGVIFQSSGLFNYAKEELYNKSLKSSYKLSRCLAASIKTNLHLFFLQAAELVLNIPHISEPYKIIGFMVWSNKCKFVLILAAKHLLNLYDDFKDLL
jgi:hypothetical protein